MEFLDARVELIAGALNQIAILDEDVSNFNDSLAQINGSVRRNAERFDELKESVSAAGNLITILVSYEAEYSNPIWKTRRLEFLTL